ncbi:uncharacterized protein K452DRAFT_359381 [Aplosporella prunicola CBS 121167]|uniref:FAD-binding domain-containing protein n=1 Tax=Aplosporella prunicola CBS 121167 TaxID=1176127 RepID=A0A6A6BBI6_9PEZI|nr:uncharacterized protein K452DRAFT_359381 [Aplosporella prunicola CBS 121167]KAF2140958.1 hypothetical protein K452DRAFT_359381 [Aplosporella prunicola CBS 121167]
MTYTSEESEGVVFEGALGPKKLTASYPTRSLEFLKKLYQSTLPRDVDEIAQLAECPLNIIIVGAGIGGLATAVALAQRGHDVTVFEQAPVLVEVGAGIQVPPNSTKLLRRWGVEPHVKDFVEPKAINFRRWENGAVIGHTQLIPDCRTAFGAPYYVVHRAHYQQALYDRALELGVNFRMNSRINTYDAARPSLTLEDGKEHVADVIIGADGINSNARKAVLGIKDKPPVLTGFAAYRATVNTSKMLADPDTRWLLENPGQNCWIGERQHAMTYVIAGGSTFNVVLSHSEESDPSSWEQETAIEDANRRFADWDPCLTKVIGMIETTLKWPLMSGQALDRWTSASGRMVILGDAAHAMLPYMSQGAAIAVEDAGCLATLLSLIRSTAELPAALEVFEKIRIPRANQMQEASAVNSKLWHFADGPEQKARDEAMRPEVEGRHFLQSPNQWSDPVTQAWCYGYDAEEEARKAWTQWSGRKIQ